MKEGEKIRVEVNIFGIDYTIITDSTPFHTRKVAAVVHELMVHYDQMFPKLDSTKVGVLTSLQLADEKLRLEQENQELRDVESDPTQSDEYRKLHENYKKLRDDHAKLRSSYNELKQKFDRLSP